jgi:chemotaxis protein histidine kinase CheA
MDKDESAESTLDAFVKSLENTQLLDKSVFKTLLTETSPEIVAEILVAYNSTLQEGIDKLKERTSLTVDEIYKVCHKIKGSSLLVGFKSIGNDCILAMEVTKSIPPPQLEDPGSLLNTVLKKIIEDASCVSEKISANFSESIAVK